MSSTIEKKCDVQCTFVKGIVQPFELKMVLCSSREIVSFKNNFKLAGPLVFYSGSNESSLAPQFKWLDTTFNQTKSTYKKLQKAHVKMPQLKKGITIL